MPTQGGGTDPWETGSYDLALEEARIEDFNIVAYTSVVPPEATEVPPHVSCEWGMPTVIEPAGKAGVGQGWSKRAAGSAQFKHQCTAAYRPHRAEEGSCAGEVRGCEAYLPSW